MEDPADIQITEKTFGSKSMQQKFEQNMAELLGRINTINDKVKRLNKTLNLRNNRIVHEVSSIIHNVLHDASALSAEIDKTRVHQHKVSNIPFMSDF